MNYFPFFLIYYCMVILIYDSLLSLEGTIVRPCVYYNMLYICTEYSCQYYMSQWLFLVVIELLSCQHCSRCICWVIILIDYIESYAVTHVLLLVNIDMCPIVVIRKFGTWQMWVFLGYLFASYILIWLCPIFGIHSSELGFSEVIRGTNKHLLL